jgi:hypothetical protein
LDFLGSHGGEYEDGCLLGCKPCGLLIALMMEAAGTSKTSINFYQTTRRNNSENSHLPCGQSYLKPKLEPGPFRILSVSANRYTAMLTSLLLQEQNYETETTVSDFDQSNLDP